MKPPVFTCVVAVLAVKLHPGKVFALTAGPGLQELLEEVLPAVVTCGFSPPSLLLAAPPLEVPCSFGSSFHVLCSSLAAPRGLWQGNACPPPSDWKWRHSMVLRALH